LLRRDPLRTVDPLDRVRSEAADELQGTKKDRECLRGLDCNIRGTPLECSLMLCACNRGVKYLSV